MVLNNRTDTEGNQPPGKKAMDNKEGTKEGSKMTYTKHGEFHTTLVIV